MLTDDWQLTEDIDVFLAHTGDFLRSRPALHNTPLTDIEKLRVSGTGAQAEAAVFGWFASQGEVRAIFYRTPRGRLGLTPLSASQADGLAARLTRQGHLPVNVIADHDTATVFARAWQQRTGAVSEIFWRTHLYRLGTLTPPQPRPEGQGRIADGTDHEQVVRWCREFCVDVKEQSSIDLIDAGRWVDSRFGDRHFTFWHTSDGTPVSMAATTSLVGGMIRLDPVYTPSHLRGRGFAGAVTAEASRAALAAGATDVVLFTDPDNPTSNALYQRLGYIHVGDFAGYRFSYTGPDTPSASQP
ncbi:GNAT family N-acetyltransferase [Streptomyces sp. ML-6]|uniref:GNAT family N-acetyltransferase n=1 Tax=Streptomyces sp. ML-6 TaxID=2982693 RepID=UPI0024C0AD1D|nr:GNAT family N-acetyltransferase [Streptomyces sp. ML-6]MDK0517523.1 GNAT family N-acetyltransferase [Streptomyces sp. ML-6]MDK0524033.1 GNAT family N-acetyltransferase [Streptomyces sp. ML-6]MDK0524913.1 GNAT family N-acetyltransferase [Streptomyces sp. ML-6]